MKNLRFLPRKNHRPLVRDYFRLGLAISIILYLSIYALGIYYTLEKTGVTL